MAQTIKIKNSSVVAKVPVTGDLAFGEIALNYADGKIYYKKSDNTIQSISGGVASVSGTAPIVSSGGATPAISIPVATTSVSGYLSSTNWTTFNNKAPTASPTFTGTVTAPGYYGSTTTTMYINAYSSTTVSAPITLQTISATTSGAGGAISITAADAMTTGVGGSITLAAGKAVSSGSQGGGINLYAGMGYAGAGGPGGSITLASGDGFYARGGAINITSGGGDLGGGDIQIQGGADDSTGNGSTGTGGTIRLQPGLGLTNGTVKLLGANTATLVTVSDIQTVPTSTTTGALVVNGGAGISGKLYVGGLLKLTTALAVVDGGTGTTTPALVQGTNVTITGTWPNQTINAAGGAETDTLATVTARGATTAVVPTFSKGLIAGSSVPFYHLSLDFGSDAAGSWRVLGTVSLANTVYSTAAYKITITDPNANHAVQSSVNADEYTYYVACVRTESTITDSPDLCVVRGPYSHIRAVKTSVGNYQIQVSNEYLYQEYLITIQCYANNANANAITFLDGTTAGGAGTAVYAASVGAATEHFQKINTLGGAVIQGLTVGLGPTARAGNTALGVSVLTSASATGTYNTAVGTNALQNSTSGSQNLAIGASALQLNTFGNANSAVGTNALYNNLGGFFNTSFGASSLYSNTSGAYNSAIGTNALQLSTGSTNTVLGYNAGSALTTGNNNTIIGSVAGTAGLSDTVIIAAGSAERMRIDSSGNVGIGTTTPQGKVDSAASYGTLPNVNYLATSGSTGQGLTSGYSFKSTFIGTGDNGPRRSADIWSGYSTGAWGTEYLAFGVGIGGQNDGGLKTTERMRIDGSGNLGIGTTSPSSKLTVAGQIESTVTGFKFPDGTTQATAATGANWTKITTTTTATTKKQYVTDTTAGAFTVTLPASPAAGDYVYFMDAGNWATNNLTVARNGSTIEASATDLVFDVRGLMVQLIYDGTTWQVMSNIGPQGPIGPAQGVGKVIAMAMIFGG